MLSQIALYRNKEKFANIPVTVGKPIQRVTQVPLEAMEGIWNFVNRQFSTQRYGEWSWEWMESNTR